MQLRDNVAFRVGGVLFQFAVMLLHAVAGCFAFKLLPGGFPLTHARFFVNQLLPPLLVLGSGGLLFQFSFTLPGTSGWLAVYPALWLGFALSTAVTFPMSGGVAIHAALLGALVLAIGWRSFWFAYPGKRRHALMAAGFGLGLGMVVPPCERAAPAATHPIARVAPEPADIALLRSVERASELTLRPGVRVQPNEFEVTFESGTLRLSVRPLLTFFSRSPDGFWTIFSPQSVPMPESLEVWSGDLTLPRAVMATRPRGAWLDVDARTTSVELTAWTQLSQPIHSHLNSFSAITLAGHRQLGIAFSPCPDRILRVQHADYPSGAPARFAYVNAAQRFVVVEASDAEKGPFKTLAEGPLAVDAAVTLTFHELAEQPPRRLARVTLHDWARQLSTQLSPTAGYGVPENAIEFGLSERNPNSWAHVYVSLSSTGVGRGWDTVTQAAGAYRSRIEVEILAH